MNRWSLLLALLLAAHGGLAAYHFRRPAGSVSGGVTSAATSPGVETVVVDAGTWARLQEPDAAAYVARLRAAGFSPAMLRALVAAYQEERYEPRREAIRRSAKIDPATGGEVDESSRLALRAADREARKERYRLLGADAESESERLSRRATFGDIAPEKAAEVLDIQSDYAELQRTLQREMRAFVLPDDALKLELLDKSLREDLSAVLSPGELEAYDLRSDGSAKRLRWALRGDVVLSDEEYRALYALQKQHDEQFGDGKEYLMRTVSSVNRRLDAAERLREDMVAVLAADPARRDQLEAVLDGSYLQVKFLAERLGLPAGAVTDLVRYGQGLSKQIDELNRGPFSPEAAERLVREATAHLREQLGADGLEIYTTTINRRLGEVESRIQAARARGASKRP